MKRFAMLAVMLATTSSGMVAQSGQPRASAGRLTLTLEPLPPTLVDLSAQGKADWVHWGYVALPRVVNRKATPSPLVSELTRIGTMPFHTFENNPAPYAWQDGAPVAVMASSNSGLFVDGRDNGFGFSVLADGKPRVLRMYAGYWGASQPVLEISSSESGVAPVRRVIDPAKDAPKGAHDIYNVTFVVRYEAAAGQALTVRWINTGRGNIQLHAATVE